MRVLLIGGQGYIGSALYEYLKNKGPKVPSIDIEWFGRTRDIGFNFDSFRQDYGDSSYLIEQADVIVLVAAHSSVQMCNLDPYGAFQNNVGNFVNLIQKIKPGQKLIYASSSCVYDSIKDAKETDSLIEPKDYLTLTKQTID